MAQEEMVKTHLFLDENKTNSVCSVSYTHLDVYKRQDSVHYGLSSYRLHLYVRISNRRHQQKRFTAFVRSGLYTHIIKHKSLLLGNIIV